MTDVATTAPAADAAKVLTVIDNMDSRRLFDTTDEALAYLEKCQADFADFAGYPVAAVGLTEEGFDPAIYDETMRVAVAVLTKRGDGPNSTTVHAIVIYPAPKLFAILGLADDTQIGNSAGLDWLTGIMEKELNHVAVRNLRKAEDAQGIADAIETMPTTVADYITSGRESGSGVIETYNTLWQIIKKGIGQKVKQFALRNLSKKELRKAMESASYAATVYGDLEKRRNKKGEEESAFVKAAELGQLLAKANSLDSTIFDRMLANRDETVIDVADDEDDFDIEAMAASLIKTDDAPAAETEAPAPAAE